MNGGRIAMKKTHYIVDIALKEIHDGNCPRITEKVNTLDLDEPADADIFRERLGFTECETCHPQSGTIHISSLSTEFE
jgi:hypothetical protein